MLNWTTFRISVVVSAVFVLAQGLLLPAAQGQSGDEDPLQISATLKPTKFDSHQIGEIEIKLSLPEQYKAYEEQFHLELESPTNFKVSQFTITPVHAFWDDFSKRNRRGIVKKATLRAPVEAPADVPTEGALKLRLTYQACTKSYCLFPITKHVEISFQGTPKPGAVATKAQGISFLSQSLEEVFKEGLLWTFVFVFLAGVLTSFTPCIYPIVPITLAVLSRNSHLRTKWQSVILAHAYVLGIAMTYALLGLLAASTGALFGTLMSSPYVIGFVCLVFLAMALSMLGLYDIQPPARVQAYLDSFTHFHGPLGAFATGVVSGLVASPCVGPALVGILTYVAKSQNLWLGFWLLFVFALGMGQIFLVLGLSTHLTKKLPKSGPWLEGIKTFSGILLLGVFYYYLSFLVSPKWLHAAIGAGFVLVGSLTFAFREAKTNGQRALKGIAHAMILAGVLLALAAALGRTTQATVYPVANEPSSPSETGLPFFPLTENSLTKSKSAKRFALIDFHADWCEACKELDRITFVDPGVKDLLQKFDRYKFDATNDSPELDKLREKYKIVGLPWVVFIDQDGHWLEDLTLAGFEDPPLFVERLNKVLKQPKTK